MNLFCPKCKSQTDELIECEKCGAIGCPKCVKKSYGKWVCHKCPEPENQEVKYYYPQPTLNELKESNEKEEPENAFAAMFG